MVAKSGYNSLLRTESAIVSIGSNDLTSICPYEMRVTPNCARNQLSCLKYQGVRICQPKKAYRSYTKNYINIIETNPREILGFSLNGGQLSSEAEKSVIYFLMSKRGLISTLIPNFDTKKYVVHRAGIR